MENSAKYWAIDHAQFGPISLEPLTRIEQVAEANLSAANAMIPQVTHHDYAEISAIEAFRERVKSEAQQRGVKLTALAFHLFLTLLWILIMLVLFVKQRSPVLNKIIHKFCRALNCSKSLER